MIVGCFWYVFKVIMGWYIGEIKSYEGALYTERTQLMTEYRNSAGERKSNGNKGTLKTSQAYPWKLGLAIAEICQKHAQARRSTMESILDNAWAMDVEGLGTVDLPIAIWDLAELGNLLRA